ncbi:MAG: MarR family transcriptional regulator [Sphingomonadaceae bacterium]
MPDEITSAALKAIRRILRAADQGSRKLAAATGLTPSQLLVLQEISRFDEITPGAIAATLQFGQATVTNIVDRLESAGLASRQRNERDKRQMLLRATPAGRSMLESAPDLLQNRFQESFTTLPAWERAMILAALERLGELLDASEIDAAPLLDVGIIDRVAPDGQK